ncbi:MAG: hypothetical protein ACE5JU_24450 [Candidatus Binatia bacterium]
MPRTYPEPTKQKALAMFAQAATLGQVSEGAGVPRATARNWYRKWRKEGLLPGRQPIGRLSPEEFRQWVNTNLGDLVQVIEHLRKEIPEPRSATTEWDVLGPLFGVEAHATRLRILRKQLHSYTRQNSVWMRISSYQKRVAELLPTLDQLLSTVKERVGKALDSLATKHSLALDADLKESFAALLFYHAVAMALGEKGFYRDDLSWREKTTTQGYVELTRGAFSFVPVPPEAKDPVKGAFEELMHQVANIRLVQEVRPQFAWLKQERRQIVAALEGLLVV